MGLITRVGKKKIQRQRPEEERGKGKGRAEKPKHGNRGKKVREEWQKQKGEEG